MKTSTPRTNKLRKKRMDARSADGRDIAVEAPSQSHGTRYVYISYGCRCAPCREANAAYSRAYTKSSAA